MTHTKHEFELLSSSLTILASVLLSLIVVASTFFSKSLMRYKCKSSSWPMLSPTTLSREAEPISSSIV